MLAEEMRKLYVALTRAPTACFSWHGEGLRQIIGEMARITHEG